MYDDDSYLTLDLPDNLREAIKAFEDGLEKLSRGERYTLIDCDEDLLRSEINCAEVNDVISSRQAGYLRHKYFGSEV